MEITVLCQVPWWHPTACHEVDAETAQLGLTARTTSLVDGASFFLGQLGNASSSCLSFKKARVFFNFHGPSCDKSLLCCDVSASTPQLLKLDQDSEGRCMCENDRDFGNNDVSKCSMIKH